MDTIEIAARWSALPRLYDACVSDRLLAMDGTVAASAHQSHAYVDGACLYFTFAGRMPDAPAGDGRGRHRATVPSPMPWAERYYTSAWRAVMEAVRAHGGAISHHHGVGINRARFMADALGPAFDILVDLKEALDPRGILNPGKLGLPVRPVRRGPVAVTGDPRGRCGDARAVCAAVVELDGAIDHINYVEVPAVVPRPRASSKF